MLFFKDESEEEYQLSCLLMVFVAVSVPRLARMDTSVYRSRPEGHVNNMHSLATAINTVFEVLFSVSGTSDIEDRMKEFLAVGKTLKIIGKCSKYSNSTCVFKALVTILQLASSSLLRLGKEEAEKDGVKNRESVYLLLDMVIDSILL